MKSCILIIGSVLAIVLGAPASGWQRQAFPAPDPTDTLPVSLTEKQRADMIKSVHSKIKRLEEYTVLIASKKLSGNAVDDKIRQTVELFLSEKNFVQSVSAANNPDEKPKRRLVREYFVRLATIPAVKVEITFYEVTKLTKLRPGPEPNTFYATALIYQDTKIYYGNDVKVDYYDRSIRQVDIITRINIQRIGDENKEEYVTKLGNIHVKETK